MKQYFYIITLRWAEADRNHVGTSTGVADVYDGETQETVYKTLFAKACADHGAPTARSSVTHYYLARNELEA